MRRITGTYALSMAPFVHRSLRRSFALLSSLVVLLAGVGASQASAGATRFKNCTAVHKKYKHGIAKSTKAARHADGQTGKPKISLSLYRANQGKDRDHDGVACEA